LDPKCDLKLLTFETECTLSRDHKPTHCIHMNRTIKLLQKVYTSNAVKDLSYYLSHHRFFKRSLISVDEMKGV